MKIIKNLFLLLVIISLFCSCSKPEGNLEIEISSENKTTFELSSKVYSNTELSEIISFKGNIKDFCKIHTIDCVRSVDLGYRISFVGNQSIGIIIFNKNGDRIFSGIYELMPKNSSYETLKLSKTLGEVQKADPNGVYSFLYTGRNDIPKTSEHYSSDGYLTSIEYDNENNVVSIAKELI